jgi:preprotein translocase subunit SecD
LKNLSWRAVSVITVIIVAVIYILPTIKPSLWPHKKINLGLDLQGGMHLVLEVDTEKAVESTIERISQEMRSLLKKEHIRHIDLNRIDGSRISVQLQGQENIDRFEKLLNKEFKNLRILSRSIHDEILTMILDLPDRESAHIKKLATEQALETIRNRIDQFGVGSTSLASVNRIFDDRVKNGYLSSSRESKIQKEPRILSDGPLF